MVSQPYDIFRRGTAGDHIWVEAAHDLETAKSRIIELSAETPGQYVVFNHRNGRMVGCGTVVASSTARATSSSSQKTSDSDYQPADMQSETLWK
jgi:hypothetical protein